MNMTMDSAGWCEEFYSVEAEDVPEQEAVAHSLKKWIGLRPDNLAKYGFEKDEEPIDIDSGSCALCRHYIEEKGCRGCPLKLALGHKCDDSRGAQRVAGEAHWDSDVKAPWQHWTMHCNPEPMIKALKKALKKTLKMVESGELG